MKIEDPRKRKRKRKRFGESAERKRNQTLKIEDPRKRYMKWSLRCGGRRKRNELLGFFALSTVWMRESEMRESEMRELRSEKCETVKTRFFFLFILGSSGWLGFCWLKTPPHQN